VVFVQEEEHKRSSVVKIISNYVEKEQAQVSVKSVAAIEAIQLVCNALVVLFYGSSIYSIGEVKIEGPNGIRLINGVFFGKFTLKKLIGECINNKLKAYLERLYQKKHQDFTE
jgi:hypothetical protein